MTTARLIWVLGPRKRISPRSGQTWRLRASDWSTTSQCISRDANSGNSISNRLPPSPSAPPDPPRPPLKNNNVSHPTLQHLHPSIPNRQSKTKIISRLLPRRARGRRMGSRLSTHRPQATNKGMGGMGLAPSRKEAECLPSIPYRH